MAVDVSYRKKGVGSQLMSFADDFAIENCVRYLKTDTYSINDKMINMFLKFGFTQKGTMNFLGKEKYLTAMIKY